MASTARIEELRKKYEENQRRYFAPLANEYRKAGQLEEAIALCRAWLPQQPGHMSGHIVFGQTLFEAGELTEAQTVFETALELDPENLIALRHLGDIARQHGELDAARSWYKRVLDADPRNEEISALLAELDALTSDTPPADAAQAKTDAPDWSDVVVAEAETPLGGASIEIAAQADSAETAAWDSGTEPDAPENAATASTPDEADTLFDASTGTVGFDAESSPLEQEISPIADDASAGTGGASDLGLEVMEFVPPPREPARTPRGEPSPFDGHLLQDDADGSGATPAAFVTETMAELYLQQGFRDEALGVYRQLLQQSPDDEALRDRVEQLERGSRSSVGMAAISDEVIESAQRRQAAHTPPSMRAFLAKLAVRRAPRRGQDVPAPEGHDRDDDGGSQGALSAPDEPAPDSGLPGVETSPEAWQLAPDEPAPAASDDSPYAADTVDTEADTAEWNAEDEERLSSEAETSPEPEASISRPPMNGTTPSASQRSVGAVGSLFAGAVVQAGDDAAANALASAFAPQPGKAKDTMAGRPTRAAKSEISLDHVFRESGSRPAASRERNSFSFDQFFSENASGNSSGEGERSGPPDDDAPGDDIEQFNSWLEGLKKK